MGQAPTGSGAPRITPGNGIAAGAAHDAGVGSTRSTREQRLELYYYMRLTRTLEERLVNLYRQTKVVGGLFRSLGQEADAVGSAYALDRRKGDILSPLIRNLGSMLVQGATPVESFASTWPRAIRRRAGASSTSTSGIWSRGFIGQISQLGDMVPVMAGVTLSFKLRGEDRVGLVYVGDGATSTGAFHEGINFAAVQSCPLVVIVENNGYAYSTPVDEADGGRSSSSTRPRGTVSRASAPTATTCSRRMRRPERAVDRARAGGGVTLIELVTYRRKGHAEHDNQSYVPAGRDRALGARERSDRPLRRACCVERDGRDAQSSWTAIDARVQSEIDAATDEAAASPMPEGPDALDRRVRRSAVADSLWFRSGIASAVIDARAPRWSGARTMAEITYLEAIRQALVRGDGARRQRVLPGRGHRRVRRRVQGHRGAAGALRRASA